jgi:glycosyltransferase involved in cell wall biosynthesis
MPTALGLPPMTTPVGRPLRVTFLCRSLSVGGAERQLVALANGFATRGYAVTIVAFYPGGPLERDVLKEVSLIGIGKSGRYDVVGPLWRLRAALTRGDPDVVHAYLTVPNLASLVGRRGGRRPRIVWGLRASDLRMDRYDLLSRATYRLEGAMAPMPDLAIVNSQAGRRVALHRGFPRERLAVVPNGIDLNRFRPDSAMRMQFRRELGLADDDLLVGHVARIDPMKDHETFLQAFRILRACRSNARALCAVSGHQEAKSALEARIAAHGLAHDVRVVDLGPATERLYPALDLFCLSSSFGEGFPNVVGEALACGVPAAVTDVGDAAWLVGGAGAVAPPSAPDALAQSLASLADAYSPALAAAARARAEVFSVERMVDRTEALLTALCGDS